LERHGRETSCHALNQKWASKAQLQKEAKGLYPNLHSQSVQQIIADFCEAVESARQLRRTNPNARYPWRKPRYKSVIFTNQGARIRDGKLILPCGKAGQLKIKLPDIELPGRLMEARLHYGLIELICKVPDEVKPIGTTIGVDLGVNTLIAATDSHKAVLVSGRAVKSTIQWRNKRLAEIQQSQASKTKGSRRWKRLQRRKYRVLDKSRRRIDDLLHKATRKVADAFPNAKAYVGKSFNAAAQTTRRTQAQQISQACNGKITRLLDYKLSGAIQTDEHYSSQTCPSCGKRHKHRRVYRCECGVVAPRDVIGGTNILCIGEQGQLLPNRPIPVLIQWVHPAKYSGKSQIVHADTMQVAHSASAV
jgi:putative transposase